MDLRNFHAARACNVHVFILYTAQMTTIFRVAVKFPDRDRWKIQAYLRGLQQTSICKVFTYPMIFQAIQPAATDLHEYYKILNARAPRRFTAPAFAFNCKLNYKYPLGVPAPRSARSRKKGPHITRENQLRIIWRRGKYRRATNKRADDYRRPRAAAAAATTAAR